MDSTPVGTKTSDKEIPVTELTPIGAKMPDPKTPTTESSKRKEKVHKEYVPEDPESDPSLSDSLSSKSDFSDDSV